MEAARERDFGQARAFVHHQPARPLESEDPRRSLWRHAEFRAEQFAEVAAADVKFTRKLADLYTPVGLSKPAPRPSECAGRADRFHRAQKYLIQK
jgi:hypothetical protein